MKVVVLLACAVLTTKTVTCASISQSPFDLVEWEDLTEEDRKQLKILEEMYHDREKRSHSYHHHQEDPLTELKESLKKGLKAKLALVAKGSASASAHLSKSSSKGSSGGDYYHHHHHHDESHDHKSFDFWSLKKSILNTLLQAVKAIKGGVIAIKGQLIKGSGYLISAKGKLISAKGEAITKLGKNIATSAILSGHHHHGHADYGHYHHSSEVYGAPSAPGPEYEVPEHIHHPPPPHEDKPDHGGILILKKIPSHTARGHSDHVVDRKVPDFKPIKPSGPSFTQILGKFFKASTSLTPGEPAPFDDHSSPGHDDYHHDHEEYHADHHGSSHEFDHPPSGHESHHDSSHEFLPSSSDSDSESYKLSSYGSPFEEAPSYLDIKEHKSESIQSETYQKSSTEKPIVEILKPSYSSSPFSSSSSSSHHNLREISKPSSSSFLSSSSSSHHGLGEISKPSYSSSSFSSSSSSSHHGETSKPSYSSSFSSSSSKPGLGLAAFATNPHKTSLFTSAKDPLQSLPPYHATKLLPTIKPISEDNFGAFKNAGVETSVKYLSPEVIGQQVFPAVSFDSLKSSHRSPYHSYHDSHSSSSSHKIALKRPPRSHKTRSKNTRNKNSHKPKRSPNYQVVRSAPYKLGPKGPKRI